jgi:6-phosphogluconolactonase
MTPPREYRYADREALASDLADAIAADLRVAVAARGAASLVVSGGSTPRPLFAALARIALPWEDVWVTLADERWVDADDEASNERLVRRHLRVGEAAGARLVGLRNAAPTPEAGREACEKSLAAVPRPFDVVVLGMGDDGHTASLFPGAPELAAGLDRGTDRLCLAVRPPAAPHPRMSLTLAAILGSRRLVVHISGEAKWEVYRQVKEPGPVEEAPIRAVLASGHEALAVYWAP